jgi:thymidylate synthase
MNKLDQQYTDLLKTILEHGVDKKDRTGTGTKSIFGYTIRHNMKDGFPLLTTKKMPWKTIVTELLWFLSGSTNIKYLVQNGCMIWNGDCYSNYLKTAEPTLDGKYLSQPEFIHWIKTDDEFAEKWGNLGKIYGSQWRSWGAGFGNKNIDQIQNLINDLKTNPDSRRLMVSAWAVHDLPNMVLPPCHYGFQVYTRELSFDERKQIFDDRGYVCDVWPFSGDWHGEYDGFGIPRRAISLMWNQRSVDTFLGLPFNIASYGLLLEILAKEVNMVPDQLIGNLGDVHLYSNHIEQAKEQIGRDLTDEERYNIWFTNNYETGMERYFDPNNLPDYENDYYNPTPKRTREPFPLPTLKFNPCPITGISIEYQSISQFEIENYQSHPAIKAPLSN